MSAAPSNIPSVADLLLYYISGPPAHQASLRDWLFREWALRGAADPWGCVAGQAFDAIELHRKPVAGRG